ncbi:DUF2059 domain-containing protein [Thermomonas sp.]|uniref:DUF2059 domain-containing protein n=1 Tax=Thermomonas sp. TaxID=1971895 RepID=UPI0024871FE4|nr:DUF2059 domain-containing protein [Thermomonas sp.]MDI1252431.1 DUF2059 domain-containing protein [Thermomonas sp.]
MRLSGLTLAAVLAFACTPALADNPVTTTASTQASSADIDRLLQVMDMQTMMAGMMKQMSDAQRTMVVDSFGKDASDDQRTRMQAVLDKTNTIVQQELSWRTLEPVMRKVYAQVFSKAEVTAMITFYSSPEGASILKKSPQIMGLTMHEMQPLMVSTMEKVKAAITEEIAAPKK